MDQGKILKYFTNIIKNTGELSTCYKVKVGAVISENGRIISSGYNGVPGGVIECQEYNKILSSIFEKLIINELHGYKDIFEYMKLKIADLGEKGERYLQNEHLISFIEKSIKEYFTQPYIDSLIDKESFDLMTKQNRINMKKEFYSRNNVFHSSNSIMGEVHAEQNAILYAAKRGISVNGCDIYVNYLPCQECAKFIKQSGIKEVYYLNEYSKDGKKTTEFFKINGIKLTKIKQF